VAVIEIEDLHKTLAGRPVLAGVSLSVEEGTTTGIIGSSGVGKSTLIKHIVGLMRPDRGTVRIAGADVAAASPRELDEIRQLFGVVFQGAALLASLTVEENVALPLRERSRLPEKDLRERVRAKLRLVGLTGFEEFLPEGLSGGMRKRVGLARALIHEPRIVLYDEPTSGLDPVMANQVLDLVRDVRARLGVTSILITHDIDAVKRVCDRVAMLHEGRVIAEGTPTEMLASENPAVKQLMYGLPEGPLTRA